MTRNRRDRASKRKPAAPRRPATAGKKKPVAADPPAGIDDDILARLRKTKRKQFMLDKLGQDFDLPRDEVDAAVERLVDRGEIVRTRKGRIALADRLGLVSGKVSMGRRGKAVVVTDDGDVPIALPRDGVRPAMHGDRVLVEVEPYRHRGLRSGILKKIVERGTTKLVGSLAGAGGRTGPVFVPGGRHAQYLGSVEDGGEAAKPGDLVAASIVEYPTSWRGPIVRVERVLGRAGMLPAEIEAICETMGIPARFDPAAEAEARGYAEPGPEVLEGRLDLRAAITMTIDPSDARDHDDAVSIERIGRGYRLTVSIADVSYYVRPGTALDAEALERGTSVYFPGRAVAMLPEHLSSSLASLVPDVDRLTVSAILEVDETGEIRGTDFARSVIRSRRKLSYERAQEILDGADGESPQLVSALQALAECAGKLRAQRKARGAIDLDLPEAAVTVGADGQPAAISRRPRLATHRLIEEMMLAANEAVARRLEEAGVGFLYRIHERPDADAVATLASKLSVLGLRLPGDGARITPAAFQKVIERAAESRCERLANMLVLRTMTQARYSPFKEIHFGLASECYTHFTSPIRRYPDLVTHRALCALLEGKRDSVPPAERLAPVAEQCSGRERRAMEAERDANRAAAIIFMQDKLGRTFDGTVTGVDRAGFWVELERHFVEGFVPVARLTEYYDFIAERMELHSRTSSHAVRVGDPITVRVVAADLADRRLDFEPVRS